MSLETELQNVIAATSALNQTVQGKIDAINSTVNVTAVNDAPAAVAASCFSAVVASAPSGVVLQAVANAAMAAANKNAFFIVCIKFSVSVANIGLLSV